MSENEERLDMTTTRGSDSPIKYTRKEIDLIKSIHAKGATDDEFKLMIHLSKEYGLNILQKHIWLIKFNNAPALIFVGRDGYLDIAHRSGYFNGMETDVKRVDEPFSKHYEMTEWVDGKKTKVKKTFSSEYQYVATCTVWRKDTEKPFKVTVYEEEYSTGRDNWETKRRTMIGKVAESQNLRKAFSVSGVYSPEEIDLSQPPMTPDYEIQTELPKRSLVAKKFSIDNCVTMEDYDRERNWFCEEFGEKYLLYKSGHKNELFIHILNTAHDRINGIPPVDANKKPEEIVKEWKAIADKCSDTQTLSMLEQDVNQNRILDTEENWAILETLHKELD